jgi:hypothetical protein
MMPGYIEKLLQIVEYGGKCIINCYPGVADLFSSNNLEVEVSKDGECIDFNDDYLITGDYIIPYTNIQYIKIKKRGKNDG